MRWLYVATLFAVASRAAAQPAADSPPSPPPVEGEAEPEPKAEPAPRPPIEPRVQPIASDPVPPPSVVVAEPAVETSSDRGFRFGSYGRAIAGSDLRGGKPAKILVVGQGPRIVEDSYLELEFSYGFQRPSDDYVIVRPIITIAFDGTLFHDTGEFDAQPAIRNMFLDGRVGEYVTLWVGSRMYRGDDIYLFDYWPLDDQNTMGGGIRLDPKAHIMDGGLDEKLELAAHVGLNRLNNPFQYQTIDVANPVQGATTVEQLNRQRMVASTTLAYIGVPETPGGTGIKLKVHGEYHSLPSGTRKRLDGTLEDLPSDSGFLAGAQLGVFGMSSTKDHRRHVNFFARYAKGLASFDELAPPLTFGSELKTTRANELSLGVSANWDHALGNMMVGALSRRVNDADDNATDPDDGWEYAIDARPLVRLVPSWFVGADVSYQARFPKGLNAITLRASDPAVFQIAPMIAWSPMGPSAYDRPQIRLVYRAAHLNDGALDLYVPDDPRHGRPWVHFLGLQAEWWFNSSTYR